MRYSTVVSGIKGIFPLIKKHAPHCITLLPALDALPKSTRLAIDATLLVQRLHFADDAHPSRHIIGFHRLIRQMRDSSLIPIMVFDNFNQGARLPAKMRENQKRRERRNLLVLRANMERLRGQRLEALAGAMKDWSKMRQDDRMKLAELLQAWDREEEEKRQHTENDDTFFRFDNFDEESIKELHRNNDSMINVGRGMEGEMISSYEDASDFLIDALPREDLLEDISRTIAPEEGNNLWSSIQEAESSKVLYMASRIHRLRRQYGTPLRIDQRVSRKQDSKDVPEMLPETPNQARMTIAEGSVYRRLQSGTIDTEADVSSLVGTSQAETASLVMEHSASEEQVKEEDEQQEDLIALTAKNVLLQRSYNRSSTPLSRQIFESCVKLCEILKVPVLWTGDGSRSGGRRHEAEALASVLVQNKLADVVVSEDSDVLLYQVPLLRGVMGHKGLEYIDSVSVRSNLFPPSSSDADTDSEKTKEESHRQMLDFALLCGTDFNRTVPGIGPHTALKLIQEYKSIDGIRKESERRRMARRIEDTTTITNKREKKIKKDELFSIPDDMKWREFSKELNEARKVFENPPSVYWEAHKLNQHKKEEAIDYTALSDFLHSHNIAPRESNHDLQRSSRKTMSNINTSAAFGGSPFSDGKSTAASWPI